MRRSIFGRKNQPNPNDSNEMDKKELESIGNPIHTEVPESDLLGLHEEKDTQKLKRVASDPNDLIGYDKMSEISSSPKNIHADLQGMTQEHLPVDNITPQDMSQSDKIKPKDTPQSDDLESKTVDKFDAFDELDPSRMEAFLSNPKNAEQLVDTLRGLAEKDPRMADLLHKSQLQEDSSNKPPRL